MRYTSFPIGLVEQARPIVIAAVQFSEPALSAIKSNSTLEWDPLGREQRVRDAKNVLDALFSNEFPKRPDVVVFAEYSLPADLHRENYFQNVADKNKALIIAGSYFQRAAAGEGGFNICKIYVPKKAEPIVICQWQTLLPDKDGNLLKKTDQFPNIARLILHPKGASEPFSINVFLSYDFLAPFQECIASDAPDPADPQRVSLLDWEHDGVNIAIFNTYDPRLLEGAALLDSTPLHGRPKFVLLVSSANVDEKLATALFAPSAAPAALGHLAAQLSPAMHGVLLFEAGLWSARDKSEKSMHSPLTFRTFRYEGDAPNLIEQRQQSKPERRRGIFHPALLEALQKHVVFEMFVARSAPEINQAFREGAIRHVNASHVRGIEDVLIKKYVADGAMFGTKIPGLSVPHCYLSKERYKSAFEEGPHVPHLKVLLNPRGTLKFRGKGIPQLSDPEWEKLCVSISRTTGRVGTIDQIVSLAKNWPADGRIDEKYRDIFIDVEDVVAMGKESQIRESYLLISTKTPAGISSRERFRDYIRDSLIGDHRVRDIHIIEDTYITPEPEEKRNQFEFLLRLKCTIFEADDILDGIARWGESAGVQIGTRTYDVWKPILRDSLGSIGDRISTEGLSLLSALLALSGDVQWKLEPQLRERFARAIERRLEQLEEAQTDEAEALKQSTKNFYYNVCLHSISYKKPTNSRFQREAKAHITDLYGYIEYGARKILTDILGISSDCEFRDIKKALGARIAKSKESPDTNLIRILGQYYASLLDQENNDFALSIRSSLEEIAPLRNDWVHHNESRWYKAIFLPEENWEAQFVDLDTKIGIICNLITEMAKELDSRGLS